MPFNPYRPEAWYWKVGDGPAGQVYSSAAASYVSEASDPGYLAHLASGNLATVIDTEANLRDELERFDVPLLALPLRPLEVARPRTHRARLRLRRAAQSVASGVLAPIQWNAAGFDPLGMNAPAGPNPDRITIPAGQDGLYMFAVSVAFAANATGIRGLQVRRGPATSLGDEGKPALATGPTFVNLCKPAALSGGDVVRLVPSQDSGGALSVDAEIYLWRIE